MKINPGSIDRMLFFGGPYSNLAATRAMKARAQSLGIPPERIICNGDLVAYCGEPAETIELIRDWGIWVVMGNCEESLAFDADDCGCGFEAGSSCSTLSATWYRFAQSRINAEQRCWMRALPRRLEFTMDGNNFAVLHGSVDSINAFVFASTDWMVKRDQLDKAGADVIIGGHCGIPFGEQIGDRRWLNTGVIGMPANDGGCHSWYMLIEPVADRLMVSWHRLDYEHRLSYDSTLRAGMKEYAQALLDGIWPSMDILPPVELASRGLPLSLKPLEIGRRNHASQPKQPGDTEHRAAPG